MPWAGDQTSYQKFVDKYRLTFPQAIDQGGELYAHFGVPGQPAWVFVDRSGAVARNLGAMEPEDLRRAFDTLLAG